MNAKGRLTILSSIFLCSAVVSPLGKLYAAPASYSEQSVASSEEYDRCSSKTTGYNWAHAYCATYELERQATIELNVYSELMKNLDARQKSRLKRSERAWDMKVDRICHTKIYLRDRLPGTTQIVDFKSCRAEEYAKRIDWLEQHYGSALRRNDVQH